MMLGLQLVGGFILAAVALQAGIAVYAQAGAALRARQMDRRKLERYEAATAQLMKQAEIKQADNQASWSGKRKFRVVERRTENKSGNVCSFYLAPHDGGKLPTFLPGQFLTFELDVPGQAAPVIRCYSLSDSPLQTDRYRVSVKRLDPPADATYRGTPGCSSGYFHNTLREGDVLSVMAPNGSFHLDTESDRPVVLIAGGIGLTPVLSMLKWLSETNSARETWFFFAASSGVEIALVDEVREIVDKHENFHLVVVFSNPTADCVEGKDFDCGGKLSVDLMRNYLPSSNYEFYLCGPPPLMKALQDQLNDWGVPAADIRTEAFGPASVSTVVAAETANATLEGGCNVEFTRTGCMLVWTAESGTLLEFAEANNIRINSGCRSGNCSTCLTALKGGEVSYIRSPAAQPEQGSALMCIARPDGDISLDA